MRALVGWEKRSHSGTRIGDVRANAIPSMRFQGTVFQMIAKAVPHSIDELYCVEVISVGEDIPTFCASPLSSLLDAAKDDTRATSFQA